LILKPELILLLIQFRETIITIKQFRMLYSVMRTGKQDAAKPEDISHIRRISLALFDARAINNNNSTGKTIPHSVYDCGSCPKDSGQSSLFLTNGVSLSHS
jgi:hypothetical protein